MAYFKLCLLVKRTVGLTFDLNQYLILTLIRSQDNINIQLFPDVRNILNHEVLFL